MTTDDVALAARVVVAMILIVSGLAKVLALGPRRRMSRAQHGANAWTTLLVALALPVYELALAVLLLVVDASWPSWLALLTFALFTVVLVHRIVRNDRRPCNCFGVASAGRDLSMGSLLRNSWFLVLALLATGTASMQVSSARLGTVLLGTGFLAVSAVLVVRT